MKITVIIEGGMIQAAYATDAAVELEVIDRDTQDYEELERAETQTEALREAVEDGNMTLIY